MVTRLVSIFSLSCTPPPPFQTKLQTLLVPCSEELPLSTSVAKATQQGWKLTAFVEHSLLVQKEMGTSCPCHPPPTAGPCSLPQPKHHHGVTQPLAIRFAPGLGGGKPQMSPWVSPWCLGTWASVSRAGTWLGHSQCWGAQRPAKGTRTYCIWQAGPSTAGVGFSRAPKISYAWTKCKY